MIKRLSIGLLLTLAGLLVAPLAVYAMPTYKRAEIAQNNIAAPATHQLQNVWAYRNALEINDMLFIGEYSTTFTPPLPSEGGVNITFLARLMNGATEYKSSVAYAYFNSGYNQGIFSLYFSASEVSTLGMGWNDAADSMIWEGNPAFTWATYPIATMSPISNWFDDGTISGTATAVGTRCRLLASELQSTWATPPTYTLLQTVTGTTVFTSAGEDYFTNSIANLRTIQPNLFTGTLTSATAPETSSSTSYLDTMRLRLVGTAFDMTDLGASFGLSRMWMSSILWLLFSFFLACVSVGIAAKWGAANRAFEFSLPVFGLSTMVGSYTGFFEPLAFVMEVAIFALILIVRIF